MFGFFKKKPDGLDQLTDFVGRLAQSKPSDLGLAIATVEHTAHVSWLYGDFYKPAELVKKRPDVIPMGVSEVQRLQAVGLEVMAVGWIVWVHTFRSVNDQQLLPAAREMWSLIVRGAPYAFDQIETVKPLVGFPLQVENPDRIPLGFS